MRFIMMLAAALAVASPANAQPRDWTETIATTPAGGVMFGNPDAPVKLVEFLSLTCDHCAQFAATGNQPLLSSYVASGKVSFEIRNFVRDPADLTGAVMAHCAATGEYLDINEKLLASQGQWLGRLRAKSNEELNQTMQTEGLEGLAHAAGIVAIGREAGLSDEKRKSCLADQARVDELLRIRANAVEIHKVRGTPSFLINDRLVAAHDWASLKPMIDAALER